MAERPTTAALLAPEDRGCRWCQALPGEFCEEDEVTPIPATPDLMACADCMNAPDDPERFGL